MQRFRRVLTKPETLDGKKRGEPRFVLPFFHLLETIVNTRIIGLSFSESEVRILLLIVNIYDNFPENEHESPDKIQLSKTKPLRVYFCYENWTINFFFVVAFSWSTIF